MKVAFFALLTALAAVTSVSAANYVTGVQQSAPFDTVYINIDVATVIGIRQSGGNFIAYAITADSGVYDISPVFQTYQDAVDYLTINLVGIPIPPPAP